MEKFLTEERILEIIGDVDIYSVQKQNKKSHYIQLSYEKAKEFAGELCKYWMTDKDLSVEITGNVVIINLTQILPNVLCSIQKLLEIKQGDINNVYTN